jgi:hypothetical protein
MTELFLTAPGISSRPFITGRLTTSSVPVWALLWVMLEGLCSLADSRTLDSDHPYRAGWLEAQKHMPSKEHLRAVQQSLMRCVGLGSEM